MASSPPAAPPQRPFVTRRSTLAFTAVFMMSYFVEDFLLRVSTAQTGPVAALLALSFTTAYVTLVVSWIEGFILGVRSQRLVWMLVACLPPPIGSLLCGLWAPSGPKGRR
jgi:hypothetical protein